MKKYLPFILLIQFFGCKSQNSQHFADLILLKKGQVIKVTTSVKMQSEGKPENNLHSTNLITVLESIGNVYKLSSKIININSSDGKQNTSSNIDSVNKDEINKHFPTQILFLDKHTAQSKYDTTTSNAQPFSEQSMEKITSEMFFGNATKGAFFLIPKGKKIGDSWTIFDSLENYETNYNYTLENFDSDTAKISFKGKRNSHWEIKTNNMQAIIKNNEDLSGELYVSIKSGFVKSTEISSNSIGTVDVMGHIMHVNTKTLTISNYTY